MTPEPLAVDLTALFVSLFDDLDEDDQQKVEEMLHRLSVEHGTASMRDVVRVGSEALYATPRIYAPGGVFRVTWVYDESQIPTAIACITVAPVDG